MAGSDKVNKNLRAHRDRAIAAINALGEQRVAMMEADAKVGAPWDDKTGEARKGLFGYTLKRDLTLQIRSILLLRIAHTMDYGVYLELTNQGKYAILDPVAKKHGPQFFEDVNRVVGR